MYDDCFRTTTEQFNTFRNRCLFWLQKFQCAHWNITFEWVDLKTVECHARVWHDYNSRTAKIQFTTDWDNSRTLDDREINRVALKEVTRIACCGTLSMAHRRFVDEKQISDVQDGMIRRIEHVIMNENVDGGPMDAALFALESLRWLRSNIRSMSQHDIDVAIDQRIGTIERKMLDCKPS